MQFKKGTKVTATEDLRGVPEGTTGVTGRGVGITWFRYRVYFDNGVELGSVGQEKLVRAEQWEQFKVDRAKAAEEAEATAATAAAAPAAPAEDASGGNDRLAALMAKSKAAREGKGGGDAPAAEAAPADDAAGGNDRLAALMAKSKAARDAKS